jgi:hypothetical protein
MPDAVPSDVVAPPAPEQTAPEPDTRPQASASRAPQGLISDQTKRQVALEKGLETALKQLRELNRRCGLDFVLSTTWKDAESQRFTLSSASDQLKGLLEDIQPDVALSAYLRTSEVARRLAFARAAEFSSLSIGLMQRAVGVMLDMLMHDRKGSLPYSSSGEAIEPADVQAKHAWSPAAAVSSWRAPKNWDRSELKAVAAAAVQTPQFMSATLPRLLRKLDFSVREQAELQCSIQQLHRTTSQPSEAGAEQAEQCPTPDAQEPAAAVPPRILAGAPSV